MKAHIITIGDEILIGQIVDTNSAWIAEQLVKLSITTVEIKSISDNREAILSTLHESESEVDLIIITGGLGPTKDDITKKTLTDYFNTELVFNEEVHCDVVRFIQERGSKMNALNNDQALFPKSARVLKNRQGTAPGIWFEKEGKVIISLPGVPREMKGIMEQEAIPAIKKHFVLPVLIYKTVLVTGFAEAHLAEKLDDWENNLDQGMKLAYLPSPGIIRLRLGMEGTNKQKITDRIDQQIEKLKGIINKNILGV